MNYSADEDILGIRTPFVYEPIGGTNEDWDTYLFNRFEADALIGIVCQVKGGARLVQELFRQPYFGYCVNRLGLKENTNEIIQVLADTAVHTFVNELNHKCQIGKILISNTENAQGSFVHLSLNHIKDFVKWRINKNISEKSRDSHFFQSAVMQTLIKLGN